MCERERRERTQKHILCGRRRGPHRFFVHCHCTLSASRALRAAAVSLEPLQAGGLLARQGHGAMWAVGQPREGRGARRLGHRLASPTSLPSHPMSAPPPRDTATVSESGPSERQGRVGELGSSRQKYGDGAKNQTSESRPGI